MRYWGRIATIAAFAGSANSAFADDLNLYGTPGLIEMPSAYMLDDGEIALTAAGFDGTLRNTFAFQLTPRMQGVFRYSIIRDFSQVGDRYDRSFDLSYQLLKETEVIPALTVGLRDFGGTGIYSSEYLAASKTFADTLTVTGGLGWGRLAGRNSFETPLSRLSDSFATRPSASEGGINTTGQLDFGSWFRGDIAAFGGVSWQAADNLTLVAEYSTDTYPVETAAGIMEVESPWNVGLRYAFDNGLTLGAHYLYGTQVGAQLSYVFDPAKPPAAGGVGSAPPPLVPRDRTIAATWGANDETLRDIIARQMASEGLTLENLTLTDGVATVRYTNDRYLTQSQGLGRAARVLANAVPASVETFDLIPLNFGLPLSQTRINRAALEAGEFAVDGAARTLASAEFTDGRVKDRAGELPGTYPAFRYRVSPYAVPSFFDPDSPIRVEYGAEVAASFVPAPGLILSGQLRQPIGGNLDEITRESNSVLPRVRSNLAEYYRQRDLTISYLTGEYFFRPGPDLFGRVTAGYLEQMFGGVSAEVLWFPVDSRLALGAEVNYAKQREFEQLWGFQDYDVVTGHVSAYYDLGNGFHAQVDAGRYLAGDWGATFALDREFNNGFKVGAYFTLTDVPFDDFGEGSFDKGIRVEVPLTWLTGQPSQRVLTQTFQPVVRDGGARLNVRNRLYDLTRSGRGPEIADSWGVFLR